MFVFHDVTIPTFLTFPSPDRIYDSRGYHHRDWCSHRKLRNDVGPRFNLVLVYLNFT